MLEIERQNRESAADGQTGSDGSPAGSSASEGTTGSPTDSGSQGKGLLRRGRRAVTRPAGPPAADPPASGPPASAQASPAEPRAEQPPAGKAHGEPRHDGDPSAPAVAAPDAGTGRAPRKRPSRARVTATSRDDQATSAGKGAGSGHKESDPAQGAADAGD